MYAVAFHSPAARDSTRGACVVGGQFSCCGHRSYRSSLLWRIDAEGLVKNRDDKKERERERSEAFLHIFPSIDWDREADQEEKWRRFVNCKTALVPVLLFLCLWHYSRRS